MITTTSLSPSRRPTARRSSVSRIFVPLFAAMVALAAHPHTAFAQSTPDDSASENMSSAPSPSADTDADDGGNSETVPSLDKIPPPLLEWEGWVEGRNPALACPRVGGAPSCSWPGMARYEIKESGGSFSLTVRTFARTLVPLPSTDDVPIHSLEVLGEDGKPVRHTVINTSNGLQVEIPAGSYLIRGVYSWESPPETIPAPGLYGLVAATDERRAALAIERDGDAFRVVDSDQEQASDSLTLRVMRRITDSSPASMTTRLTFRVSGAARSIRLGRVLPENALPISVESSLPIQLQRDGSVAVQLVAGEHIVTIESILAQPLESITLPAPDLAFWPEEETLVWVPNNLLRSAEVTGADPLSAELSQLPSDWEGGATYVAKKGQKIDFRLLSRGEVRKAPDGVQLNREIWLDLDGAGFTIRDAFTGTLTSRVRLNALPETRLGRASSSGAPLLIAPDPGGSGVGVEIRDTTLNLEAVSRIGRSSSLSAVGWDQVAQNLSLSLWLPPSWKLLGVSGAQTAGGSWFDSWTLLDVFLSMLIAVAAFQLFGLFPALLTAAALILNHGEFLAPRMLFIHVMLLTLWRLVIKHTDGLWHRVSSLLLAASFAAWSLQSLAFMKLQITQLLYPQLQAGTRWRTVLQELLMLFEGSFMVWPYVLFLLGFAYIAIRSIVTASTWGRMFWRLIGWGIASIMVIAFSSTAFFSTYYYFGTSSNRFESGSTGYANEYAPAPQSFDDSYSSSGGVYAKKAPVPRSVATNQAFSYQDKVFLSGPALPAWRWHAHTVHIDGPVDPGHTISFFLLSPFWSRLLSLLRVLCLGALVALIFRKLGYRLPQRLQSSLGASAVMTALIASLAGTASVAKAEAPDPRLLDELQRRIEAQRCQSDRCATILEVALRLSAEGFELQAVVSSRGRSAVSIPGPLSVLLPTEVMVDGKQSTAVRRTEENYLQVQVEAGISRIQVKGSLPEHTAFALQFPDRPHFTDVETDQWFVEGVSANGTVSESVRFTNRASDKGSSAIASRANLELPYWTVISRQIVIADQISVNTIVTRLGSTERTALVSVPLLDTERVTSEGVRSEGSRAIVTLGAGSNSTTFTSSLPYAARVVLRSQPTERLSEEWTVLCAPIVHCTAEGLTPAETIVDGTVKNHWLPFGGEEAVIHLEQLAGISGDLLTVDTVEHRITWGTNLLEGSVVAQVRGTQQQSFVTKLPAGAELRSVNVVPPAAGTSVTEGAVPVLLNPGSHRVEITYTLAKQLATREYAPAISFNAPVHNVNIRIDPGTNRWLLWTGGLPWGPAVVFWSKLFFVSILTVLAASRGLLPTSPLGAAFLGVGLATLPLIALAFPLAWLLGIQIWPTIRTVFKRAPSWVELTAIVITTLFALATFYRIVQIGLILQPPMLIAGNQSTASALRWFVDHADRELPQPWVISLSLFWWRVFALIWSTWLVLSLCRWLKRTADLVRTVMGEHSGPTPATAPATAPETSPV